MPDTTERALMQPFGPKKTYGLLILILTTALIFFPFQRLNAWEDHFELELEDMAILQNNYMDRSGDDATLNRDGGYNLLNAAPMLWLTRGDEAFLFVRYDFLWHYEAAGQTQGSDSESTVTTRLTSAYISLEGEWNQFSLGIQPVQFASGLITADDAPAAMAAARHKQWTFTGQAAMVLDRSPLFEMTLSYEPGLFEHLALFGIWFEDKDDAFAETLTDISDFFKSLDPDSDATLWWLGGSAQLFAGKALLTLTAAREQGDITFNHRLGQIHQDVDAYLMDFGLEINLTSFLSLELFFFSASGDDSVRDDTLNTFVSPLPYNPRALIFFDSVWLDRDITDSMAFGGGTFYGVDAPGVSMTIAPLDEMLVDLSAVLFYPDSPPDNNRDAYGWEIDLETSYDFRSHVELYVEAGYFAYGNYFKNGLSSSVDAAQRLSIGCRFQF